MTSKNVSNELPILLVVFERSATSSPAITPRAR